MLTDNLSDKSNLSRCEIADGLLPFGTDASQCASMATVKAGYSSSTVSHTVCYTACVLDDYFSSEPICLLSHLECFHICLGFVSLISLPECHLKQDRLATFWQAVLEHRITRMS